MFETIKGIIGDIATGAIKDHRIALSEEQLAALDLKFRDTLEQLSLGRQRVAELEPRVSEFQKRIAERDAKIEQLTISAQQQRTRRSETNRTLPM